jgi:hypothetical protein
LTVLAPPGELARPLIDQLELERAAAVTRGRYYGQSEMHLLFEQLPSGQRSRVQLLKPRTLWNAWPVALLFVTVITGEWILRRRAGLM